MRKYTVQGTLKHIIFHNEKNGYLVGKFKSSDSEIIITGVIFNPILQGKYIINGKETKHHKYGDQFEIISYEEIQPTEEEEIVKFLSGKKIKGVGEKTAKAIVNKFGKETFDVIENRHETLISISGISAKKANLIHDEFLKQRVFKDILLKLREYGVTSLEASKIYGEYEEVSIEVVEENPYMLSNIYGISFNRADQIGSNMGILYNDPRRIGGYILLILKESVRNGNTYVPRSILKDRVINDLEIDTETFNSALMDLSISGEIFLDNIDTDIIYLEAYYLAEQSVTENIIRLINSSLEPIEFDQAQILDFIEVSSNIVFSEEQKKAVLSSIDKNISIVTGGPGTGKTTIIKGMVEIFNRCGLKTILAAPTGRAAKRLSESSGCEARTIHRMLEYSFFEDDGNDNLFFNINKYNPLEADVVIVDEASMIDIILFKNLLEALQKGTRLIMVGDVNQLPSVGAGNVLADLINSDYISSVELKEIFRQAQESLIITNAHNINNGLSLEYDKRNKDFNFIERTSIENVKDAIIKICTQKIKLPEDEDFDIQVLTPSKNGELGKGSLNNILQAKLNPPSSDKSELVLNEKLTFRKGDKVMHTKNDYSLSWIMEGESEENQGVFNGEIGVIKSIDSECKSLVVRFDDGKLVEYNTKTINSLDLSYAITIHKSQGSEFPVIIIPILRVNRMLSTRNLLYTAVTRGKNRVIVIGSKQELEFMASNNRNNKRYSGLKYRLDSTWEF